MAAESRSTMEARLIERAAKDEAFRRQLVDDPHAALQQALGVSLPGSVNIEVLEETHAQTPRAAHHLFVSSPLRGGLQWGSRER
jgi:hypothetical protein